MDLRSLSHIVVNPAVQHGRPCIAGTRVPVETIGDAVWSGQDPHHIGDRYDVGRDEILLACWYVARHGEGDGHGLRTVQRHAWQPWLAAYGQAIHDGRWEHIPMPSTRNQYETTRTSIDALAQEG